MDNSGNEPVVRQLKHRVVVHVDIFQEPHFVLNVHLYFEQLDLHFCCNRFDFDVAMPLVLKWAECSFLSYQDNFEIIGLFYNFFEKIASRLMQFMLYFYDLAISSNNQHFAFFNVFDQSH